MVAVNYDWDELEDNIVEEYDDARAVVAEYTTEPDLYGNLISQNRQGDERQFHFDVHGSTLALTDGIQQVMDSRAYTAFGESTEVTGDTLFSFQYLGRVEYLWDSLTGNCLVRIRVYQAERARWLSADPLGGPVAINRYVFGRQNPLTYRDWSGFQATADDQDRYSCEEFKRSLGGPITIGPSGFLVGRNEVRTAGHRRVGRCRTSNCISRFWDWRSLGGCRRWS